MSRVLVTGAAGFVGRYCLPRLKKAGYELHSISSRPRRHDELDGGVWHQFDLLDPSECRRAIDVVRPTHLLHLAWLATPGLFWSSADNIRWLVSSIELFRAFFESGGTRTLGLGTCAEYCWTDEAPLAEAASPTYPDSIYGQCKAAAGFACNAAASMYGGSALWVRLFYPYGPGEPVERLIPSVITGLTQHRPVQCSEASQLRDFIFIEDVGDALVALLSSQLSGLYNLGTGRATSVREVVGLIASILGRPDLVTFGARANRSNDPMRIVADIDKLSRDLNWRPRVALRDGIERTIKEHCANHH